MTWPEVATLAISLGFILGLAWLMFKHLEFGGDE